MNLLGLILFFLSKYIENEEPKGSKKYTGSIQKGYQKVNKRS